MKICINNSCKAELDDYMERCPECGRLQKQFKVPEKEQKSDDIIIERHGFITFWLWIVIVGNMLMAIISFFPKTMWGSNYPDAYVIFSIISGLFSIVNVVGAFMLLAWKKMGFTIIALSAISGGLFAFFTIGTLPTGIVGLIILWLVLNIKKNGVSYWNGLD